jgi:aspartate/methionine/tyrosine aminotransferase
MKKVAGEALQNFHNQYPSLLGIPELRQAIARHSKTYQGLPVDWESEVLVTVGATEAIASVFLGLLNPGDEVSYVRMPTSPQLYDSSHIHPRPPPHT